MTAISKKRLLVMGANGMLGNAVLRWFATEPAYEVIGSVRRLETLRALEMRAPQARFVGGIDASSLSDLRRLFAEVQPEVVINCVGVVKQIAGAGDPATAIPINALLPHRLARLCERQGARLVHIGTDCVFSGSRGSYVEDDVPDAIDLYGRSKLMGEVDYPHAVTLRTSIIGHELNSDHGLISWFLGRSEPVRGFASAIFSALPTVELARVIGEHVIPNQGLHGTYHVAGPSISKYELLKLVADSYGAGNPIMADHEFVIDRSLDAARFAAATGYQPAAWPQLIASMREFG